MESKNASSTLKTTTFGEKNITNYPLTLRGFEFLKFSFLQVEDLFLSVTEIIKINEYEIFLFNQNFQFIRQKLLDLLYIYIAAVKGLK